MKMMLSNARHLLFLTLGTLMAGFERHSHVWQKLVDVLSIVLRIQNHCDAGVWSQTRD